MRSDFDEIYGRIALPHIEMPVLARAQIALDVSSQAHSHLPSRRIIREVFPDFIAMRIFPVDMEVEPRHNADTRKRRFCFARTNGQL